MRALATNKWALIYPGILAEIPSNNLMPFYLWLGSDSPMYNSANLSR